MNSTNTSRRMAKFVSRFVLVMAMICLVVAALPAEGFRVAAATTNAQVASLTTWQNTVEKASAGDTVNVSLTANININVANGEAVPAHTMRIPEGVTVNLYMCNKNIKITGDKWENVNLTLFDNKGTFNIYAGTPDRPNNGSAAISINNTRREMDAKKDMEAVLQNIVVIQNSNKVTVNSGVSLSAYVQMHYNKASLDAGNISGNSNILTMATGIYNTSSTCETVLNSATISASAIALGIAYDYNAAQSAYAFARGVLGGKITANGDSNVSAHAETYYASFYDRTKGVYSVSEAYCFASSEKITINGGEYAVSGVYNGEDKITGTHLSTMNAGIIAYKGTVPTITDGNFKVNINTPVSCTQGLNQYTVSSVSKDFKVPTLTNPGRSDTVFNTLKNVASSGNYYDETGWAHAPGAAGSSGGVAVQTVNRGAVNGKGSIMQTRVHVVYRFWETSGKSNLKAYAIAGADDARIGKNAELTVNGSLLQNNTVVSNNNQIIHVKMYESANPYYWDMINIGYSVGSSKSYDAYAAPADGSKPFGVKDSVMQNATEGVDADGTKYIENDYKVTSNDPLYIYIDYAQKQSSSVQATFGTGNVAEVTYTGSAPVPNETPGFNVKITKYGTPGVVWTNDYNLANVEDDSLLNVTYSYVNTADSNNSGVGLPVNAGTYLVTYQLEDDTSIDRKDNVYSKNRQMLTGSFTLRINKANALRGNLIENISLTYGDKLGDKLSLNSLQAGGVNNEAPTGTFMFTNGTADSDAIKSVCTNNVLHITWNPSSNAANYQQTTFTVYYTINPAPLTITPTDATVVYGNSEFSTPYGATISGLVANDNTTEKKTSILDALSYVIHYSGSDYIAYVPGGINVGTYSIQPKINNAPAFLANYNVVYNYGEGYATLAVTARPLTVYAEAVSRAYNPTDYNVAVNFTITDGIFEGDEIAIKSATGTLKDNKVGKQYVENIDRTVATSVLTGLNSKNYTVGILNFADGANLTVEITKAVPQVSVPVVSGTRYYTLSGKLSEINLNVNYTPEIEGTWAWDDNTTNPQVLVDTYPATFTPKDTENYQTYSVAIPVEILPSEVVISYNASVTYGDPRPNLTLYTYSCETDESFSIGSVVTSGNLYPSTTYDQYDGVNDDGYVVTLTNSNYRDVNGNYTFIIQEGLITVTPKTITVTADNASITYGENFDTLFGRTVSYSDDFVGVDTPNSLTKNGSEPQFTFSTDYDYQKNYRAGIYNIFVSADEAAMSPNYKITYASGILEVKKAPLLIAATTVYVNYGETIDLSNAYVLTGLTHGETSLSQALYGQPKPVTTYMQGSPVTAEGYTYYFDFTGVTSDNYTISTTAGKIIVNKINPVVSNLPTARVPFGSPLSQASFDGGQADVPGKFVFDAADAKPPYSSDPYNTGAIVYSASFIPDDTVNYNVLSNQEIVLTITKGIVSGELLITGYPMKGQTLTADLSALTPADATYYTYAWTVGGSVVSTAKTYTVANANEEVVLTVTATGPYDGNASASVVASQALTVAEPNEILAFTGLGNKVYTATQQEVIAKNMSYSDVLMGNITVKYNGSKTIPTAAGTYNVTVDIALPENFSSLTVTGDAASQTYVGAQKIYAPVSNVKIGELVITPAEYIVNVTVSEKEYDGTNIAAASKFEIVKGAIINNNVADDVSFDETATNYLFDSANVGTGKTVTVGGAFLAGASKDNYTLKVNIVNANDGVITAKTLKAAVVAFEREYEAGNTNVDVAFDIDLSTLAQGDTDADVYFAPATATIASDKAGMQDVTVATGSIMLEGAKAGNYVWEITNLNNVTVLIDKATPDYPMPEVGLLTYDSGRTLDDISLGDSRWSWVNGNVVPGAGTATYTAVFTPKGDTANYKTVEKEVTLTINKAQIVITATSYILTYGDPAPTYGYTVTGLTGADTLDAVASGYAIANCSYELGSPVRAGGYPVTVTGYYSSANYDFRYVQGLLTVNARPLYVNATVADRNYSASNYDVTINFSQPTNVFVNDAGNVALAAYSVTGSVENNAAGTRAVSYTAPVVTGSAAANYVLVINPSELTVEIKKAQPLNVVMPTTAVVVYGSPLSTAVFTSSKEGDGVFRLENATSYPAAHGIFSDVYKVEFIPNDSVNYATVSAYITLTVEKKPLAVSAAISGTTTAGETLYVITSAIDNAAAPHIVYEWYRIRNAGDSIYTGVKLAEGVSYTLTDKDVGYYIACAIRVDNSAPYSCDAVAVSESEIEEVKMSFWQKIWAWFYKIFASIGQLFGSIG